MLHDQIAATYGQRQSQGHGDGAHKQICDQQAVAYAPKHVAAKPADGQDNGQNKKEEAQQTGPIADGVCG